MSTILPTGFLTICQAAQAVERALFAGEPDRAAVKELRGCLGHDLGDGEASSRSVARVWRAVDQGMLRPLAIREGSQRALKIKLELTRTVPLMRHRSMPGFNYLRPSHRDWKQVTSRFGMEVAKIFVAFRETEVKKLVGRLLRARRHKLALKPGLKRGRPSVLPFVCDAICEVVDGKRWDTTRSIKELTRLVNRSRKLDRSVSEDSVRRALDKLHATTNGDRRYERMQRRRSH
jgi:hypothetical protein